MLKALSLKTPIKFRIHKVAELVRRCGKNSRKIYTTPNIVDFVLDTRWVILLTDVHVRLLTIYKTNNEHAPTHKRPRDSSIIANI